MISSDEVFARLKEVAPSLRNRGVTHLSVFGSVARGDVAAAGDLDILIRLDKRYKNFDAFMDIKFLLEELFPARKVDLVLEDALKPTIRERILSEARDVA